MKIQCPCGAKYAFEVTPEMADKPVRFVCASCGLDSSEFVNQLVREELAGAVSAETAPTAETEPAPPPVPPPVARLHLHKAAASAAPASTEAEESDTCPKHPNQPVTHHCVVCRKAMCPKCMELFGYVCSPLCRARADSTGIHVPVFAGQKSVVEAKRWRKVAFAGGVLGVLAVAAAGFWIWYAWVGSVPKPVFSLRFDERAWSGQTELVGADQLVFLHGGTLARCDLKTKKQIWSRDLIDHAAVGQLVANEIKGIQRAINQANADASENVPKMPPVEEMTNGVIREMAGAQRLHLVGQNLWVAQTGRLVRYDWATGTPGQAVPLPPGGDRGRLRGNELWVTEESASGQARVTRVDLTTGQARSEAIGAPNPAFSATSNTVVAGSSTSGPAAGLPTGRSATGQPMDPAKVAAQAQHLPMPAKIVLPATLAISANQERAMAEMNDSSSRRRAPVPEPPPVLAGSVSLIPSGDGFVQFSSRLIESRVVTRQAMKAAPKNSALEHLSGANSAEAANEILNEMQRSRGGDKVTEDESRYQVTVRRPDAPAAPEWTGEVTGPPELFALKTVNIVAAGKSLVVLDAQNKKLWQAALTYNIAAGGAGEGAAFGAGPCVERGDTLYVFDQAVLTAFELATGTVRWRLPTVGVVGLFFDDAGNLYVNTTTASPDSVKYSRQIDITEKVKAIIVKLEARTGKTLWTVEPGGFISYLSGKFIYTVQSYDPGDDAGRMDTGLETPPYLRIRRLDPSTGRVRWEHYEPRAPVDVAFDQNLIRVVFKKEVEVLKFLSF